MENDDAFEYFVQEAIRMMGDYNLSPDDLLLALKIGIEGIVDLRESLTQAA